MKKSSGYFLGWLDVNLSVKQLVDLLIVAIGGLVAMSSGWSNLRVAVFGLSLWLILNPPGWKKLVTVDAILSFLILTSLLLNQMGRAIQFMSVFYFFLVLTFLQFIFDWFVRYEKKSIFR